ncbi:MAG: TlpA family protein disulfide reductase [Flavobacteriales bacterium]|nr:TlpA family protein disulfide reductase [Flavobacteriales bacterium]
MKHTLILSLFAFLFQIGISQTHGIPKVMLKDMQGKTINSGDFNNDGKPYIINFWATWCSPCKKELNNIAEVYDDWVDETGVKIIAISIDDSRTSRNVKRYVDASGWDYEVYLDENSDFKRAMNVTVPPTTFLVDGNGKVVYQHISYSEGDEDELYEKLLSISE